MKVHQTSFNIRYSFFIGKLFPSELGLSPNSVFEGYDVSQFLILYLYSSSRLLGVGLSDCHTLNQLKKKKALNILISGSSQETLCADSVTPGLALTQRCVLY